MTTYVGSNGAEFTDADVERWAAQAEAGFADATLEPARAPWRPDDPMETHTVRLPADLWELVEQAAASKSMTVNEYASEVLSRRLRSA